MAERTIAKPFLEHLGGLVEKRPESHTKQADFLVTFGDCRIIIKVMAVTKQAALDKRFRINSERFVKGRPLVKILPSEVAINPITADDLAAGVPDQVNFPTLHAAGYRANAH